MTGLLAVLTWVGLVVGAVLGLGTLLVVVHAALGDDDDGPPR